jgi:hypothetical protein
LEKALEEKRLLLYVYAGIKNNYSYPGFFNMWELEKGSSLHIRSVAFVAEILRGRYG